MTAAPFDGSEYRREVLAPLRERNPAEIDDLFWLAHVPRDLDDDPSIKERLRQARGFLNKEKSRAKQAVVATAVLKEWPRVEQTLGDAGARRALRERLGAGGANGAPTRAPAAAPARRAARPLDADARRRRQVATSLGELARLRNDPDLAGDLFGFLGLPTTATREIIEQRIERVGDTNRKRRADRERTVVDELLVQCRALLVEGSPAAYLETFGADARDAAVDALLAADVDGAIRARGLAHEHGIDDAALLRALAEPARAATSVVPVGALGLGIWCAKCGVIAAPTATVCTACSASLHLACTQCATLNLSDDLACRSCARPLDEARSALRAPAPPPAAPAAATPAVHVAALPQVTYTVAAGETVLVWAQSTDPAVDAYLVERHEGSTTRVLGRTTLTRWTDGQQATLRTTWSVRALRGEVAASEPTKALRSGSMASPSPSPVQRGAAVGAASGPPTPSQGASASAPSRAGRPGLSPNAQPRPDHRPERTSVDAIVGDVSAAREPDGRIRVTWQWPAGITEAWVAHAATPPGGVDAGGRKVTNTRYAIDGGALLEGVQPGSHLAVFAGRRDGAGNLAWGGAQPRSRTVAP